MTDNRWVKKEPSRLPDGRTWYGPHPKQQRFLLHADTREVFYGGAGGGGKSQALWYGALQYVTVPGYAALILRRTYADLSLPSSLMNRSKAYLANSGATFNEQTKTWTFPSGATITFGYLENESDKYRYASAEFQYIAFDELTHFKETQYTFLFTRLRKRAGVPVPLRMRSASNPGAVGHDWVKKRFVNPKTARKGAVFIAATLDDNPSLDKAEYIASLANTDPITRAQILKGDWDAHAGGRFLKQHLRYFRRHGTGYRLITPDGERYVERLRQTFQACDPAASAKKTADFTVCGTFGATPANELLWLDCLRFQAEIPDIPPRLLAEYARHKPAYMAIEAVGANAGVLQHCRRLPMVVSRLNPLGEDKLIRSTSAQILVADGRLYLPADAPWLEEVESELLLFTGDETQDAHDDIVDTLSYAVKCLEGRAQAGAAAPSVLSTR